MFEVGNITHELDERLSSAAGFITEKFHLDEQMAKIAEQIETATGEPGASLTGKVFGFTDNEIIMALGNRLPQDDEKENLAPYMAKAA